MARLPIAVALAIVLLAGAPTRAQFDFATQTDTRFVPAWSGGWVTASSGQPVIITTPHAHGYSAGSIVAGSSDSGSMASPSGGRSVIESYPQATSPGSGRERAAAPSGPQTPHPAVVRVIAAEPGGASLGSGTLVDANDEHGLVITNWHVVRDSPANVKVVFPDGFQSMGRVLRMDSNWDLAAILINKPPAAPVKVASEAPRVGEILTIAGYGSGKYRASSGPCTQYLAPSMNSPFELVELATSARQGDSGGPIFNSSGELAGVLFGEGGGRTTGAYCRRVHNFLTLAVQQLHRAAGTQLASTQTKPSAANQSAAKQSPGSSATEYFNPRAQPGSTTIANANAGSTAAGWKRKPPAPADEVLVTGQPLATQFDNAHDAHALQDREAVAAIDGTAIDGAATASFQAPGPAQVTATIASTTTNGSAPVAAIGPAASLDPSQPQPATFAQPGPARGASDHFLPRTTGPATAAAADNPHNTLAGAATTQQSAGGDLTGGWVAATDSGSLGSLLFAGDTLLEQLKTLLAGIGVVAFLFHGTRLLARTTVSAKGARKRSKRSKRSSVTLAADA